MSYDYTAGKKKHSKVNFKQYLGNINEPREDGSNHIPAALKAELLENSLTSRRQFRHSAQQLRKRYS